MNFEPQKFFIGLVDFFSIFMPGALLTYLVKDWAALKFLGSAGYPLNGANPSSYSSLPAICSVTRRFC